MKNGIVVCAVAFLGLPACAHGPRNATSASTTAAAAYTPTTANTPSSSSSATRMCSVDADCGNKQLCIRSQCVDITPDLIECNTVRVHFDFNEANLKEDETATLQRMGRCLKADHGLHVTIEGNADERGTEEWNIALGDKRATAVESYLERLGVSQTQLKTISYGKERPLCTQHNEECWAKNRRAALKPKETH